MLVHLSNNIFIGPVQIGIMTNQPILQPFLFITTTDEPITYDDQTRRRIRRQAMSRAAYTRKKKGGYGQHNLRQYPVYLLADNGALGISALPLQSSAGHTGISRNKGSIPANLSCYGYERMRIKYNFDLLDLSALTTFHVSHVTATVLAAKPTRLTDILRLREWSYLNYLPARIGYCDALDKAAECVAARARHWLDFPYEPASEDILKLYIRALKLLQGELDNPESRLNPDVLCATELLGIYEVFAYLRNTTTTD